MAVMTYLLGFNVGAAELHGHRGARGLLPENTIIGFEKALEIGVDCLELDIGMSRDDKLVIAHDRMLNPDIVRRDGDWITARTPIRELTANEIAMLDVGRINPATRYAKTFSRQRPVDGTRMPLLSDLLALPALQKRPGVCLNVETKTAPNAPSDTVTPGVLADALVQAVTAAGLRPRLRVQSFDWRSLVHLRKAAPDVVLSFLTAEQPWLDNVDRKGLRPSPWLAGGELAMHGGSLPKLIASLGGSWWSPYHKDVDAAAIKEAHSLGLKVVVWTVNAVEDIRRLLEMGVDGIITDYPDRARSVM
ncbi:MAG: glycerophosphodiester phosphodiesterase [Hyphomicrobiaceae bacterium]